MVDQPINGLRLYPTQAVRNKFPANQNHFRAVALAKIRSIGSGLNIYCHMFELDGVRLALSSRYLTKQQVLTIEVDVIGIAVRSRTITQDENSKNVVIDADNLKRRGTSK